MSAAHDFFCVGSRLLPDSNMTTTLHMGGGERSPGVAFQDASILDSDELHRATLASIADAVFLTDDHGRFRYICPNVNVIFGYTPGEVSALGSISTLLGENLFDVDDLARHGELRNIEREVTVRSGERRAVLIHVKAVSIRGSTVLYCCRDVTELRHAEEEVRTLRAELALVARLALVRRALERRREGHADSAGVETYYRRLAALTARERDVLACVVDGLMNKQIAAKLGIAEKTVKIHRGRIMRKMSVRSVAELARLTERFGLLPPPQGARKVSLP